MSDDVPVLRDGWMQTASGRQFYFLEPRAEDILLEDIAQALSLQCRYNGHVKAYYSVAQHSVLVARCVHQAFGISHVRTLRTALFHDAAEAYVGDMLRPLKNLIPGFKEIEMRIEEVIAQHFDLEWPHPAVIKRADNALLIAERNALMPPPPRPWTVREEPWPPPDRLSPWPPELARSRFLRAVANGGVERRSMWTNGNRD